MYDPLEYRLDAIRLENFMAFEDTGWIELRPITLLFGRNSSGKSAIIRALLLLKQSLSSRDSDAPLIFAGEWVDMGTYYNAVFGHDTAHDIAFSFRVSMPPDPELPLLANDASDDERKTREAELARREATHALWTLSKGADVNHTPLELRLSFGLLTGGAQPRLKSLHITGYREGDAGVQPVLVFSMEYDDYEARWQPSSEAPLDYITSDVEHKQFTDEFWKGATLACRNGFFPSLQVGGAADVKDKDFPQDLLTARAALVFFEKHVRLFLSSIEYLPPLRDQAHRSYRSDELWVRQLSNSGQPKQVARVNEWLKSMSLYTKIELKEFTPAENLVGIYLKEDELIANLRDTGAGLAQTLPIVATLLSSKSGNLVIVEQPELHLHPEAQQTLASLFIECVKSGVCLLVETHSEHIFYHVRRLLTLSNDSGASPATRAKSTAAFMLIFVDRNKGKSSAQNICLNEDGTLHKPPPELRYFFGYNEEMRRQLDDDYRKRLKRGLREKFNVEELESLCFDLDLEQEDALIGDAKESKVNSLILYCERRGEIPRLFRQCQERRSHYEW